MRTSKRSTMPLKQKFFVFKAADGQSELFSELKKILKEYSRSFDVRVNDTQQFELWTEHEFRTTSFHPKRQRGVLFAGISIKNTHVGLYFYPLHINPDLESKIPAGLKELKKGQSAFHFTEINDVLKEQLHLMLRDGFDYYLSNGWIFRQ
jgi:hypothetical protein